MIIIKAEEKDVNDIANIHINCWRDVYNFIPPEVHKIRSADHRAEQWAKVILQNDERDLLLVLKTEEYKPVGFCFATYNSETEIEAAGELHAAYIMPGYRGGTAGVVMMKTMLEHLKRRQLLPPCIWAFDENPMQIWYKAFGWEPVVKRNRIIAGVKIPETGFIYPDADRLIAILNRTISEKSARLENQQQCRFLRHSSAA